jgi:hypothetical protein
MPAATGTAVPITETSVAIVADFDPDVAPSLHSSARAAVPETSNRAAKSVRARP